MLSSPLRHFYCRPSLSADCLSDDSLSVRLSLFIRLSPFRRRSATSGHSNCSDCCPAALQPLSGYSGGSSAVIRPFQPLSGLVRPLRLLQPLSGCSFRSLAHLAMSVRSISRHLCRRPCLAVCSRPSVLAEVGHLATLQSSSGCLSLICL